MATLNWTAEAELWLQEIYRYIAADNPEAGVRVIHGIFDRAQILSEFPEAGYLYEASGRPVRILLYGHYRIAYLIRSKNRIDIIGVFHAALDLDRYLP